MSEQEQQLKELAVYKYGFRDEDAEYEFVVPKGLSREVVEAISYYKGEPEWMRKIRLQALEIFFRKPMPTWGADLSELNFDEITYYAAPTKEKFRSWDEVPEYIKRTYERLGIPEAERKFLAGVGAQYDSEVVYHRVREDLERLGVIFVDMDTAVREYPDIVREYFGTVIPPTDNKFAALNTAVWSGGSFVYVPKGVHVEMPLQAYFRINAQNIGQFERTLIIAEEGSFVHYIEGCTAPIYSTHSLHSAVVELIAKPGATIRYTTLQNWSHNVYNLVTKRGVAYEDAKIIWVDANIGCVCEGELVYTEHGPKPIEQVEPGTKVWSFDETTRTWVLRPVVARKFSGLKQVYEVEFSNGRTLRLTDNHPLLAVHYDPTKPKKLGRYSLRWKPLRELSVGDAVVFPIALPSEGQPYRFARPELPERFKGRNQYGATYEIQSHSRLPVSLPEATDEDLCWMLGLWLADGDYRIQNGNGSLRFGKVGWSVPRGDRARAKLVELLNRYIGKERIEERKDGVYLCVNSLEFALWLKENGFVSGAKQKRIPGWVFTLPLQQKLAFLAGYLDGDGCIHRTGASVKSANRDLLVDIQALATSCGLHASAIYTEESTQDINGTGKAKTYVSYRLDLARLEGLRPFLTDGLKAKMKSPSWVKRFRQSRGIRPTRLLTETTGITRIVAIRPSVIAPTYDLEIDGTSNFVVNGILVHNSKVTMKYPCVYMVGKGARGEVLSVAFASNGQHQDAGAKMIHAAPYTTSIITSKSISVFGGRATYRGMVKVYPGCKGAKVNVRCDALLLDEISRTDTYPVMEIEEEEVEVAHEATVSKIGEEQLFYLQSRGLTDDQAIKMIVNGFFRDFAKELPMEYAVEFTRLIELQLEGSVG